MRDECEAARLGLEPLSLLWAIRACVDTICLDADEIDGSLPVTEIDQQCYVEIGNDFRKYEIQSNELGFWETIGIVFMSPSVYHHQMWVFPSLTWIVFEQVSINLGISLSDKTLSIGTRPQIESLRNRQSGDCTRDSSLRGCSHEGLG